MNFATLSQALPSAPARQRETDRGIEAFNREFGAAGVFHPDTPAAEVARLKAEMLPVAPPRPASELAGMTPDDAAKMRHAFPGVWADQRE